MLDEAYSYRYSLIFVDIIISPPLNHAEYMRYYRATAGYNSRLIVRADGETYNLTAARSELTHFVDLARTASVMGQSIDEIADRLLTDAPTIAFESIASDQQVPVMAEEVWAAGVTYRISEAARESESASPDVYQQVYDNDRPEVFFKASPSRTVGPREAVGIRRDSEWDVPEPELALVLYNGDIVGFTIGNDVSSRSIEGQNPLYLPQAKVYDRCCAIGPCVATRDTVGDPHDLAIEMTIARDGDPVFEGTTTTAEMVTTCDDLAASLTTSNTLPEMGVLLTGTALVPDDDFTLHPADEIEITIEHIGSLTNTVRRV
jgi:2-dehydro-3-deoxy-D-arabinonate dehydratase